jgi:hypothetical protein
MIRTIALRALALVIGFAIGFVLTRRPPAQTPPPPKCTTPAPRLTPQGICDAHCRVLGRNYGILEGGSSWRRCTCALLSLPPKCAEVTDPYTVCEP